MVDFLFVIIERFSLSLRVVTLEMEICRSRRFSKGMDHFERKFQTEGGVAHLSLLVSEKQNDCSLLSYQNIRSALFGFVTKQARDRRTDRQTELRLPRLR